MCVYLWQTGSQVDNLGPQKTDSIRVVVVCQRDRESLQSVCEAWCRNFIALLGAGTGYNFISKLKPHINLITLINLLFW